MTDNIYLVIDYLLGMTFLFKESATCEFYSTFIYTSDCIKLIMS